MKVKQFASVIVLCVLVACSGNNAQAEPFQPENETPRAVPKPKPLSEPRTEAKSQTKAPTPAPKLSIRALTESSDYWPLSQTEKKGLLTWSDGAWDLVSGAMTDVLDRFCLCSVDTATARANGTLKTLSVPYPVALGRLRLIKLQLKTMTAIFKDPEATDEQIAQSVARYQMRVEQAFKLMKEISRDAKKSYAHEFDQDWRDMERFTKQWIPAQHRESQERAILWTLIYNDLGNWDLLHEYVRDHVSPRRAALIRELVVELREIRVSLGSAPWEKSKKEQSRIAERLHKAVQKLTTEYKLLAREAEDHLGRAREFDAFIAFLGANEDLLVYSEHPLFAAEKSQEEPVRPLDLRRFFPSKLEDPFDWDVELQPDP